MLHARDMSFSSIISLYSSVSLLFSRKGWMDGWREAVFFFYNSKDVAPLLLALFSKGDKQRHLAW